MDHPAHLGDPRTTDLDRCGYGWGHGHTGCTTRAVTHFLIQQVVEPTFTGVTAACADHASETRRAMPVIGEHAFQPACAHSALDWHVEYGRSWCSP